MAYALHCEDGPFSTGGDLLINLPESPMPGQVVTMHDGSNYVIVSCVLRNVMTADGFMDVWSARLAADDATAVAER